MDLRGDTIHLLLSDGHDLQPMLQDGLPEDVAAMAPPPERTSRGIDALTLGTADAEPNDLTQQRWAVIVPEGSRGDAAVEALAPLVQLREEEQRARATVYRVPPGMTLDEAFRWKRGVLLDQRVPEAERPRYLLIVGDLHEVSAELQHVLANGSFVGRLGFSHVEHYRSYADKVARWARQPTSFEQPNVALHVAEDGTPACSQGRRTIFDPLAEQASRGSRRRFPGSVLKSERVPNAYAFGHLPGIHDPSTVLFTVSRGLGCPRQGWWSDEQKRARQGALLVGASGGEAALLTADRVSAGPFLPGGVWFCVASFGAGVTARSAYLPFLSQLSGTGNLDLHEAELRGLLMGLPNASERPFLAAMPQAALANPDGPLAFVGQLDLAWSYDASDPDGNSGQSLASSMLSSIRSAAKGCRAGAAFDDIMRAYREINDEMVSSSQPQEEAAFRRSSGRSGSRQDARRRAGVFMLRNDLRSFVLLGDPAARLPLRDSAVAPAPPGLESASRAASPSSGLKALSVSEEALEEAVLAAIAAPSSRAEIARRYGVDPDELARLVETYRAAGRAAIAGRS